MREKLLERVIHKLRGTGPYEKVGPIPRKAFNMDLIFSDNYINDKGHKCGSVGCIIGHCGQDPYFQRFGLRSDRHGTVFLNDNYSVYETAAANVFEISIDEACRLFSGNAAHRTPAAAAKAIRKFIDEKKAKARAAALD